MRSFSFEELDDAPLIIDAIYMGGCNGNAGDDPISRLLPVGNQGGFRPSKKVNSDEKAYVVLYTSGKEQEWPDYLDIETGIFRYYGDNRKPGHSLHETRREGNILLRDVFNASGSIEGRKKIPPFFVFEKSGQGRDVRFRGLAVPGAKSIPPDKGLIAIWRSKNNSRFQNYEAYFTILDTGEEPISRKWIDDLKFKPDLSQQNAPPAWSDYICHGIGGVKPLVSRRISDARTKEQQLPSGSSSQKFLKLIYEHFKENPYKFEPFAASLIKMMDPNFINFDITRPWRDGGRDALGTYVISCFGDRLQIECAVEAKCYDTHNGVGVKEMSRLISRIKHRQFGILITTSYVNAQAYKEIKEDGHPILVISGEDICKILQHNGYDQERLLIELNNY